MIDQTKCSRCEKPAAGWIHRYFVGGTDRGADLPLCASHAAEFFRLHPLGPAVSSAPHTDPKYRKRSRKLRR